MKDSPSKYLTRRVVSPISGLNLHLFVPLCGSARYSRLNRLDYLPYRLGQSRQQVIAPLCEPNLMNCQNRPTHPCPHRTQNRNSSSESTYPGHRPCRKWAKSSIPYGFSFCVLLCKQASIFPSTCATPMPSLVRLPWQHTADTIVLPHPTAAMSYLYSYFCCRSLSLIQIAAFRLLSGWS